MNHIVQVTYKRTLLSYHILESNMLKDLQRSRRKRTSHQISLKLFCYCGRLVPALKKKKKNLYHLFENP